MSVSRRQFVAGAAAAATLARVRLGEASAAQAHQAQRRSEPWLEIEAAALAHNVRAIARLTGGKPILAVAKNNAYGLGCAVAGPILDGLPEVSGIAVVRIDEAIALRDAGVRKPVLLMARCEPGEMGDLLARDIRLTPDEETAAELVRHAQRWRAAAAHLYVDTGMHRMGVPIERVGALVETLGRTPTVRIEGMFTELTEDVEFDRSLAGRLRGLAHTLGARGIKVGALHAASSHAVWHIPDAHLDAVRPGLAVYGGYASAEAWQGVSRNQLKFG